MNKVISATSNSKLQLGTENNKGDVQIRNEDSWRNAVYADNGSTIAIAAGGKISAAGDVTAINGNSAVTMQGPASILMAVSMQRAVIIVMKKQCRSLIAEDYNGKGVMSTSRK